MDKKTLIVIGIIVLLIGAGIVYVLAGKAMNNAKNGPTQAQDDTSQTTPPPSDDTQSVTPGKYEDYSAPLVASTSGTKLLFFHAPWCPQCRALEADIKSTMLPSNVTIFKVDYDSNQALRQKYGVILQTTIVKVDDGGGKVASYVAYDQPTFEAIRRELLP